jgi:hypothetical protein
MYYPTPTILNFSVVYLQCEDAMKWLLETYADKCVTCIVFCGLYEISVFVRM